jgi:two-component system cell cycle response regulator DivK
LSHTQKHILCIEDNPVDMALIERIVGVEGHMLIKAEDGSAALTILEDTVPDIMLIDIQLPGINGLALARRFKADGRLHTVPLIATAAQVTVWDRDRCLEAGFDDYLPKPLNIHDLRQTIRQHLV